MSRPPSATAEQYRACANAGMTPAQTAAYLRVSRSTAERFAAANPHLPFRTPIIGRPPALSDMPPDQRRDVDTLVKDGGYSMDEAIRIVTRPKVKVRAAPRAKGDAA